MHTLGLLRSVLNTGVATFRGIQIITVILTIVCSVQCHIKLGDTVTAMEWLNKSKQLSVITSEVSAV